MAAGSIVAFLRTRGYAMAPARRARLVSLSVWQIIVVEHAARRIAAADDPSDPTIVQVDDADVAGFIDAYAARLPPEMRKDFVRFLAYLEHVAPLGLGWATRFSRLGPADQDRVLASLEASTTPLLRAGFAGLKALVFMGYYRDPRTWKLLGYAGPRVNRPADGWWR
ncbi:MAG TPA: gluconate 2-dehydrogenase subunit 3 family protein [Polyangiaceae bacterium]|nr:gluconate 2-dehydrogenase subunit 3 family protein [Polyangiaceae bacterium]